MPPSKRKRHSAFEDFSVDDTGARVSTGEPPHPLPGRVSSESEESIQRIEALKPTQMIPDRFQPRRLLPSAIRAAFFSGKLNCYQAAAEWLSLAKQDAGYQSEVERLLAMGNSFEEHGQIKPITGSWVPAADGRYVFLIETGERRYWAACLRFVAEQSTEEPLLRIEAVQKPTRQRQVIENRHAEPPSAVSQACEISALILSEMNVNPDTTQQDEYEYFRQARSQRMPAGLWERITPIMQLTRPRMVQLLNILQLPSPLLDLADRYRLSERVLREILLLPQNQWERLLRLSIQNNLSSDDIGEVASVQVDAEKSWRRIPASSPPQKTALSGLRRFANALIELDEVSQSQALDELADTLVANHQAEDYLNLMGELARLIRARLARR